MSLNLNWLTLASIFAISAPLAILGLKSTRIEEPEVEKDGEESVEIDQRFPNDQTDSVKLYPRMRYSLSDIVHPFANMEPICGITSNPFTNRPFFEGSTVGQFHTLGAENTNKNVGASQNILAGSSSANEQVGLSNANVLGIENGPSRRDAESITTKTGDDLAQDPSQSSSPEGPAMWAVDNSGASSSGLLNPQEEVAKFFGKATVFEEDEDEEVRGALAGKNNEE